MEIKEMCEVDNITSCPRCKNSEFIIYEGEENLYHENKYGKIDGIENMSYACKGLCMNCKTIYDMQSTNTGFIPLTPIRKLLFENTEDNIVEEPIIANPMELIK